MPIDAAFRSDSDENLRFFSGDQYADYNWPGKQVTDTGLIRDSFPALPPSFQQKIDAVFRSGDDTKLRFFSGSYYVDYDWHNQKLNGEHAIWERFPNLPDIFHERVDAVFQSDADENLRFFSGAMYADYDWPDQNLNGEYTIWDSFSNLPEIFKQKIDAVFRSGDDTKLRFFSGSEYVDYDWSNQELRHHSTISDSFTNLPEIFQ